MSMRNMHRTVIITVLSVLAIGILPGMATVWIEADASSRGVQPVRDAGTQDISTQSSIVQVVPAAAFIQASDTDPGTNDADSWLFDFFGFITSDSVTDDVCLVAPLYLPVGSTIDSFTAYVRDDFGTSNMTTFLDRTNFFGTWDELAQVTSVNGGGIRPLTDPTISFIDNANIVSPDYNYHVSFCLPAGSGGYIEVHGARVNYSPPSSPAHTVYLPIVLKSEPVTLTNLLITNQTGGDIDYTLYGTPQGDITCYTIPSGVTNQPCGKTFTAGTYSYRAIAPCGQKVGQRTYNPGNDALTPFRCQ